MMAEADPLSPRTFTALAMPRADHPEGHAVLLVESCGRSRRERVFSRAEAEQVRAQLDAALRAFFVGESFTDSSGPEALVEAAARAFGFPVDALTGAGLGRPLVRARMAACWALRERFGLCHREIGELLGGRERKTVSHAIDGALEWRRRDPAYRAKLDALVETGRTAPEPPRACTAPYPFVDHRTFAEVQG